MARGTTMVGRPPRPASVTQGSAGRRGGQGMDDDASALNGIATSGDAGGTDRLQDRTS
jgi:hypothetical protein